MKKKLIGILVCTLFIVISVLPALGSNNIENINLKNTQMELYTNSFDDDVPIWEVGDGWEYRVNDVDFELGLEDQKVNIHGKIESLNLEVTEVTDDSYKLRYSSDVDGDFIVDIDLSDIGMSIDGSIKTTGELVSTTLSGDMVLSKNDLGIKRINTEISGRLRLKIEDNPLIQIPTITIPIPAKINLYISSNKPFNIIDFPLSESKEWGLPSATFTFNGEIKSIWLNVLNFINKIAGLVGIELIPPLIADLLPVIDIMDMIEAVGLIEIFNGYLERDDYPDLFTCLNQEAITVDAGTYNAYNISLLNGFGNIYYSPDVGNIIKISGQKIDVELIRVF